MNKYEFPGGAPSQETVTQQKREREQQEAAAFVEELNTKLEKIDQENEADIRAYTDVGGFQRHLFNADADRLLKERPGLSAVLAEREFLQTQIERTMRANNVYRPSAMDAAFMGTEVAEKKARDKKTYEIENGLYHGLTLEEIKRLIAIKDDRTMLDYKRTVKNMDDFTAFERSHPDYAMLRAELDALREKEDKFYEDDYGQPTEGQ